MGHVLRDRRGREIARWNERPSSRELAYAVARALDLVSSSGTLAVLVGRSGRELAAVDPGAVGEELRKLLSLPGVSTAQPEAELESALAAWASLAMARESMTLGDRLDA